MEKGINPRRFADEKRLFRSAKGVPCNTWIDLQREVTGGSRLLRVAWNHVSWQGASAPPPAPRIEKGNLIHIIPEPLTLFWTEAAAKGSSGWRNHVEATQKTLNRAASKCFLHTPAEKDSQGQKFPVRGQTVKAASRSGVKSWSTRLKKGGLRTTAKGTF